MTKELPHPDRFQPMREALRALTAAHDSTYWQRRGRSPPRCRSDAILREVGVDAATITALKAASAV